MTQNLNINFFNIVIIAGAFQGILFGLAVLFLRKYRSKSNFYLAQVVIYLSLNNLYYWFIDTNISSSIKYYEFFYVPWNLLVLPMYYFFVNQYLGASLSRKARFSFLLPFVLSLIVHFFLFIHELTLKSLFEITLRAKHQFYYTEEYFSILFTIFLIYKTFKLIKSNQDLNSFYSRKQVPIDTLWLKNLLYFCLVICTFWFLIIFLNQYNISSLFQNSGKYFLWISISILIYWLGYLGVYHSGIFNERKQLRNEFSKANNKKPNLKYERFEQIDSVIRNNKLYLDPNLNLDFLATKFSLSNGYLSQIFNQYTETNFSNYINELRIEKAKKLLTDKEYSNYTIVAIGLESGFNSKSAFYSAFKRITNLSPVEFRKRNLS